MAIVVALFMGLTVSAEEIIRDRKILKRESFLNLSWNSYLMSKLTILFSLSAVQTLSFVLMSNLILEIEWSMLIPMWFVLFTTSCLANVLGLNISSAFNSAVTVYVLIPLLLIPQMILSGVMFSFDKLNDLLSTRGKVPIVADLMASRWAYEALAVYQFQNNTFEKPYYDYEKIESLADFKASFLVDELYKKRKFIADNLQNKEIKHILQNNLNIIQENIQNDFFKRGLDGIDLNTSWTLDQYTPEFDKKLEEYFAGYKKFYQDVYNKAVAAKEREIYNRENANGSSYNLNDSKNLYYNESLSDLVRNVSEKERIVEHEGHLLQQINPIFLEPKPTGVLDYRAHFFAPVKNLFGTMISTYNFNIMVIWIMTIILYITLYFELLRKVIEAFGKLPFPKRK
jgi:hypothetical protein